MIIHSISIISDSLQEILNLSYPIRIIGWLFTSSNAMVTEGSFQNIFNFSSTNFANSDNRHYLGYFDKSRDNGGCNDAKFNYTFHFFLSLMSHAFKNSNLVGTLESFEDFFRQFYLFCPFNIELRVQISKLLKISIFSSLQNLKDETNGKSYEITIPTISILFYEGHCIELKKLKDANYIEFTGILKNMWNIVRESGNHNTSLHLAHFYHQEILKEVEKLTRAILKLTAENQNSSTLDERTKEAFKPLYRLIKELGSTKDQNRSRIIRKSTLELFENFIVVMENVKCSSSELKEIIYFCMDGLESIFCEQCYLYLYDVCFMITEIKSNDLLTMNRILDDSSVVIEKFYLIELISKIKQFFKKSDPLEIPFNDDLKPIADYCDVMKLSSVLSTDESIPEIDRKCYKGVDKSQQNVESLCKFISEFQKNYFAYKIDNDLNVKELMTHLLEKIKILKPKIIEIVKISCYNNTRTIDAVEDFLLSNTLTMNELKKGLQAKASSFANVIHVIESLAKSFSCSLDANADSNFEMTEENKVDAQGCQDILRYYLEYNAIN